jgi:NADP-dependent 3-hydroxy acid dehydrogenase YdfG
MTYEDQPISLAGKAVVLTGGTVGIGRAIALRLARAGAKILLFGTDPAHLKDALTDLNAIPNSHVIGLIADQSQPDDVKRIFAEAESQLGGVDILVNNAAVGAGSIVESDADTIQSVVSINLIGYMLCCREALQRMKDKGKGHIVNIGSMSATVREADSDIYVATKAGIEGFSESLRKKVNDMGIKVTLIEPGLVGTEMTVDQVPKEQQPEKQQSGEMLKAEDIADCVYYALTQPERCDVVEVRIRPHKQAI